MDLPNIIIIIIDCLRKDYAKPLENVLTKMGFISYENAIAPAPWTIPSHASIFTGLYPAFHGAHETKNKKIPHVYLAKTDNLITYRLKELGYETILLTANYFVHPRFGFRGFDHVYYTSPIPELSLLSKTEKEILRKIIGEGNNNPLEIARRLLYYRQYKIFIKSIIQYLVNKYYRYFFAFFKNWPTEKGVTQIINYLNKYLNEKKKKLEKNSIFIFINLIEMHEPYFVNDDLKILSEHLKTNILNRDIVVKWKKKYSNEIIYVTKKIVKLLHILKKHEIFDNSIIIVTSDHGQLLGEHGRIGHGNFLYDELLRVPLLIKYPKDVQITFKSVNPQTWISLIRIKHLLLKLVKNNLESDESLFSNIAFSESYGIAGKVLGLTDKEKKNIEQLEKYRIAIYYKNFKGIFNVTDWKFEEIISYNPNIKIEEKEDFIKYHMKKEIIKFLKAAMIPKIIKHQNRGGF